MGASDYTVFWVVHNIRNVQYTKYTLGTICHRTASQMNIYWHRHQSTTSPLLPWGRPHPLSFFGLSVVTIVVT